MYSTHHYHTTRNTYMSDWLATLITLYRTRLVEHSYRLYFNNQTYYRTTVLDGRLDNCAQRLTDDIETVASVVARLYSQITKPLFDLLLIGVALARLTISAKASLIHGTHILLSSEV